ncbi:MAG: alpha/beta hydrolase [Pseudomonadota bacterium]
MNRLTSQYLDHNGMTTAYYDEGEGPVFLLLHGFTGSKLDFHNQLGWFADRHRVIAPDNRGHGESTNSGDDVDYILDNLANDLHSFIETMGLENIHLLGHSMGGMVVMRYALAHPEKLASLILMDTLSTSLKMPQNMIDGMSQALNNGALENIMKMMRNAPASPEVQNGIDFLGETEHWARIEEKLNQMDPVAYRSIGTQFGELPDITESLAGINCPTTVIVGEADTPFLKSSHAMAETIKGAELKIIKNAAHSPQYENPTAWRAVISEHLQRYT